jgi:hypothetical protein
MRAFYCGYANLTQPLNQAISAVGSLEPLPSRTTLPLATMTYMRESSKDTSIPA